MIEFVTNLCEAAEDIADELTDAAGSIVTKTTPLMAALASGRRCPKARITVDAAKRIAPVNGASKTMDHGWSLATVKAN